MQHLVSAFRAVMPAADGVVLADAQGRPIAHDVGVDPQGLIDAAPRAGAGALVERDGGLFFVVFLPDDAVTPREGTVAAA